MPIRFVEDRMIEGEAPGALFVGSCVAEEADALLEWLRREPDPVVSLGACDDLHTALVQLLLATGPRLSDPPADPVLADCLAAAGLLPAVPAALEITSEVAS